MIFKIIAAIIVAALVEVFVMGITIAVSDNDNHDMYVAWGVLSIVVWILMSIAFSALFIV